VKVKLISYSQAVDFQNYGIVDQQEEDITAQDLVAFCARVSNPSNQMNTQTSERLLKYLIRHKHWSPFEMVSACLEIETTRDIAHQIVRHRSFAFQEFSQRYANPAEFGEQFVVRDARLQDEKNRQNSIDTDDPELAAHWIHKQKTVIETAKAAYEWAIDNGIAKEQARVVLPEGCTKTRLYMNGSLRSWIHYIELRGANGTQKEHMDIAHECAKVVAKIFPNIMNFVNEG
jgi:thymidylate synthase (FAD)|tara:strand:- start:12572 stop:13264 length:693 start_codon:yes stop_codon:yes gene_type:complete